MLFVSIFMICRKCRGTVGRAPHFGTLPGCFRTVPGSSWEAPGTLLDALGRSRVAKNIEGTHYVATCVVKLQKKLKKIFVFDPILFLL